MQYIEEIKKARLFMGIEDKDIGEMLKCLDAKIAMFKKSEYIFSSGDYVKNVGIVLSGNINIMKEDVDGEAFLLTQLGVSDHFAESICCANINASPVSVLAVTDVVVMLLDFSRIINTCTNACAFHSKLIENMIQLVAQKNLYLQERIDYLCKKSIRKKLMTYLKSTSKGSQNTFAIPYNREELANYLSVDRSALSRELAKLKDENIIDYWKNKFKVL